MTAGCPSSCTAPADAQLRGEETRGDGISCHGRKAMPTANSQQPTAARLILVNPIPGSRLELEPNVPGEAQPAEPPSPGFR